MFSYTICWVGLHVADIYMYVSCCMLFFCHLLFWVSFWFVAVRSIFICLKYHILFIPSPANGPWLTFTVCPFCFYKPCFALNIPERAFGVSPRGWGRPREGHWILRPLSYRKLSGIPGSPVLAGPQAGLRRPLLLIPPPGLTQAALSPLLSFLNPLISKVCLKGTPSHPLFLGGCSQAPGYGLRNTTLRAGQHSSRTD